MDFNSGQPIYLQIAEYVCDQLLLKKWIVDEKIPSVRDLAVSLEVNPNTVMRAYEYLQQQEIIYPQRGMGFFPGADSIKRISKIRREEFLKEELPQLFRKMSMLNIELDDIQERFDDFKEKNKSKVGSKLNPNDEN